MEFIENQNGNENNICKNDTVASGAIQNLGLNRTVSFTVHVYMHGNQFTNLFRFLDWLTFFHLYLYTGYIYIIIV
jgi:hypothetical protein